jgi:NADH:ubiquinone oxidoreductase subunit K
VRKRVWVRIFDERENFQVLVPVVFSVAATEVILGLALLVRLTNVTGPRSQDWRARLALSAFR